MVGLLEALAVLHIKPGHFAPHCLGSVGELQLFCLLLSGQGPGASSPELFAGKARTGLWGSVGHGDPVPGFRNKLVWVCVQALSFN